MSVRAESGTQVAVGDTLLKLSNTTLLLDVLHQESNLIQQQTNVRDTRLALQRHSHTLLDQYLAYEFSCRDAERRLQQSTALYDKQLIAETEYFSSRERFDLVKQQRDIALERLRSDSTYCAEQSRALDAAAARIEKNISLVQQSLDDLIIRAPQSGLLVRMDVRIGESITRGQRVGHIDVNDGYIALAQVDEYYLQAVHEDLPATLTANGTDYAMSVMKIHPEVSAGRFGVELGFVGDPPQDITRGQSVAVKLIIGGEANAVLLKRGPFYDDTNGQWVFVLNNDSTMLEKRAITLGEKSPRVFEVLAGLRPGQRVVISSYADLGDGAALRVIND